MKKDDLLAVAEGAASSTARATTSGHPVDLRIQQGGAARPGAPSPSGDGAALPHQERPVTEAACPFCPPDPERVFHSGELVVALWDAHPVSPGHALFVTRRHVPAWWDAT